MELKQHAAVLALTPTNQLTRLVGAGAQQLDHVGVVHLLEEAVLGEEVLQLVRRVVGLQHLHRHPGTVCVDKHVNNELSTFNLSRISGLNAFYVKYQRSV